MSDIELDDQIDDDYIEDVSYQVGYTITLQTDMLTNSSLVMFFARRYGGILP